MFLFWLDQQKLSDDDLDMKGIGVTRPAPVDDKHVPDAQVGLVFLQFLHYKVILYSF